MTTFRKPQPPITTMRRHQPDRGRRRHRVTVRILGIIRILWEANRALGMYQIVDIVNRITVEEYHPRTIKRDLALLEQLGLVRCVSFGRFQFNGWSQFEAGPDGFNRPIT